MITKCHYCGERSLHKYMVSCAGLDYFRKCRICTQLNYRQFPSHIPIEQHEKYIGY
jgi:hypothetical protein